MSDISDMPELEKYAQEIVRLSKEDGDENGVEVASLAYLRQSAGKQHRETRHDYQRNT